MVVKEYFMTRRDGVILNRSYSNSGFLIQKVGTNEIYEEAIDVEGTPFRYVETNTPIERDVHEEEKTTANNIILPN